MTAPALLAALLLLGPAADEPWTGLGGSGLLTLPDARTQAPGRATLAVTINNRDRDPLGLDLFDGAIAGTLGLRPGLELYGHYTFSRVVAVPEVPAFLPPPLDLILPKGTPAPSRPYYSLYAESPYVNHRGAARFSEFVQGDAALGLKARVFDGRGALPAVALALEARPATARDRHSLASGSGSGGFDFALRAAAEWRRGPLALVTHVGYTRTGAPKDGDRILSADAAGATVVEEPLRLADALDLGVGARRELSPRFALIVEATLGLSVGQRTLVLDQIAPLDGLWGAQLRLGRARVMIGMRYHGHDLPSGAVRETPLRGFVDLTDTSDADARRYLAALGLAGAGDSLRSGVQRAVLAPRRDVPLPAGARVVPNTFNIRSEHQLGFVALLGWAF